ncbi:MAG: nucleotidyl transferase AbiEii/AbiGii toxin family protein [Solirubrobacteraceae bacterium]
MAGVRQVSFQVSQWPRPDDLARYHEQLGVPPEAIIRDIVRIVCVAQLVHDGVLDEDWVLSGGMGMRLRGSSRFTMSDTDTSRRGGAPDRDELAEALTVDQEELLVTPVDATLWKPGKKLVSAHPIDYEAFFADVGGGPIVDAFKFTVSWRGLFEPPDKLAMLHPYPELIFPQTVVPVMNLTEQAAEKIVAWCAHGLIKHYVDVAWIFHSQPDHVDTLTLPGLIERKLGIGRALFPAQYAAFSDLKSIFAPLYYPDRHHPPLGDSDDGAKQIQFAGAGLNKQQAIALIREKALPAIFG